MVSLLNSHATIFPQRARAYANQEKKLRLYRRSRPVRAVAVETVEKSSPVVASSPLASFPILVNGCTGKMGQAVAESAISAGLKLVPVSFSRREKPDRALKIGETDVKIHRFEERENVLSSVLEKYPDLIVMDFTVPDAVNENAELYCKVGVPFVMGTTGGDREMLHKTVRDSNVYAVISPQMGKQVVAFLAAMDIMGENFPGSFSGYHLEIMESHEEGKLDVSGTAKAAASSFNKLGVSYDTKRIRKVRDPAKQLEMVGVPEEYINSHAFHFYCLTCPDDFVSFEFQHNVCGHKIYVDGAIDAANFLYKKIQSKADKKLYNMIDVLREGNMR
ncbi:hypothetical protein LUZ60_015148 [Juncus effusus]|nr:hypothetical protein LUZ60_015148 [Juncus effusus]